MTFGFEKLISKSGMPVTLVFSCSERDMCLLTGQLGIALDLAIHAACERRPITSERLDLWAIGRPSLATHRPTMALISSVTSNRISLWLCLTPSLRHGMGDAKAPDDALAAIDAGTSSALVAHRNVSAHLQDDLGQTARLLGGTPRV